MKIIQEGKLEEWKKRFTCKGCSSILEAGKEDLCTRVTDAMAVSQQYENEIEPEYYVNCPRCGTETVIKNVPPAIKESLSA